MGDSLSDLEAAHRFGVAFVGFANKPGKRKKFVDRGASAIVDLMGELLADR